MEHLLLLHNVMGSRSWPGGYLAVVLLRSWVSEHASLGVAGISGGEYRW